MSSFPLQGTTCGLIRETIYLLFTRFNAEKSKYMVMFQGENAGQNINIQIGKKSFERVEQFKYSILEQS